MVMETEAISDEEFLHASHSPVQHTTLITKAIVLDPSDGVTRSTEPLENLAAMKIGGIFGGAFALSVAIGASRIFDSFGWLGGMVQSAAGASFFRLLIAGVIPFGVLCGLSAALLKIGKSPLPSGAAMLLAGATLLPCTLWLALCMLLSVIGIGNVILFVMMGFFAFTTTVIVMHGVYRRLSLHPLVAAFAVPTMIGGAFLASSIIAGLLLHG